VLRLAGREGRALDRLLLRVHERSTETLAQ
jgi:hypothetical protein